jgi:hypothetical protein
MGALPVFRRHGARAAIVTLLASVAVMGACTPPPRLEDPEPFEAPKRNEPDDEIPVQKNDPPSTKSTDAGRETCETVPPNDKCGLDPQCGCAENETCDVTNRTTGATSCVTGGTTTLGRPCRTTGDCMTGLACIYGACRPYCKTPLSKCSLGGTDLCVSMLDQDGEPVPNVNFCTINCDPREPSGVCGSNACHWFAQLYAPNKVSDCNFGGKKAELEPCESTSDCQPGLACINHPTVGKECERWCRLDVPGDCTTPGFTCKDVFGDNAPVINGQKEGVCQD